MVLCSGLDSRKLTTASSYTTGMKNPITKTLFGIEIHQKFNPLGTLFSLLKDKARNTRKKRIYLTIQRTEREKLKNIPKENT